MRLRGSSATGGPASTAAAAAAAPLACPLAARGSSGARGDHGGAKDAPAARQAHAPEVPANGRALPRLTQQRSLPTTTSALGGEQPADGRKRCSTSAAHLLPRLPRWPVLQCSSRAASSWPERANSGGRAGGKACESGHARHHARGLCWVVSKEHQTRQHQPAAHRCACSLWPTLLE